MAKLKATVSCNLDTNILLSCLPLFTQEKVEAIEWSFDTLYGFSNVPPWFYELIKTFSDADRLIGHGVFFSLFSGSWSTEQENWLLDLKKLSKEYRFNHITEHFGFMTGEDFHKGAPISIPFTESTLKLGQDRLSRIQDACNCPVGLENLAFSYSLDELKVHGEFLESLVEPINGFVILDLHNLYCQAMNFNIPIDKLIDIYPLHRVREIHISGGSWESSEYFPEQKIRRDTHDDSVPEEVFALLESTIPKCSDLQFVVLEQLGTGLSTDQSRLSFQNDFLRMENILRKNESMSDSTNNFMPTINEVAESPFIDPLLTQQQKDLTHILETAINYNDALEKLQSSSLNNSAWKLSEWKPYMLETAIAIAQKWKNGLEN